MIEIGKMQELEIDRFTSVGAFLKEGKDSDESILLPTKQIPEGAKVGDKLNVFVYRDSSDRIISTTTKPYAQVGELAHLKVQSTTKIGAFLDIGLERDVLMPFSETLGAAEKGRTYLVKLYVDKSGRLAASMMIRGALSDEPPYKENDTVTGTIYSIHREHGVFVAVDDKYDSMIPKSEVKGIYEIGEVIEARVSKVNKDGKLVLSLRDRAHMNIDEDAESILDLLEDNDGVLHLGDKSTPEEIKRVTGLTKSAFKRAIGKLYREREITMKDNEIRLA